MTENFKSFVDSNIWHYALTDQEEKRKRKAEDLIEKIKREFVSARRSLMKFV